MHQCSISNNAGGNGGGIYTEAGSTLTIDASSVSGNQAQGTYHPDAPTGGYGGGFVVQGNLVMSNSSVNGNSALSSNSPAFGGGLAIFLGGNVSIQGTVISQNTVDQGSGGGIFAQSNNSAAKLSLDSDFIVLNSVGSELGNPTAGGIANEGTLVLNDGTTIANNTSPNCSGGTGCPQ